MRRRDSSLFPVGLVPGKVLEIGCGNGTNLVKLKSAGWDVVGQEIDGRAALQAEKATKAPVHVGKLIECDFGPDRFDLVLTSHVLEHSANPSELAKAAFTLLKPGGLFLNFTPNGTSLMFAVLRSRWRGLEPPRHMVLLGPQSGRNLLQTAGFEEVEVTSHGAGGGYVVADSLVTGSSRPLRALVAIGGQILEEFAGFGKDRYWELQVTGKKPNAP